jgi:hypothetical protein
MLDEWPEANNQFFAWRQVFFQSHPRARPIVQIAAVGGSIGGRRCDSRAVYSGSLRLENRSCHGTDHYSKPVSSPSGVRLPTRPRRHVPGVLVPANDAIPHRADEEDRPNVARSLRAAAHYFKARKQISSGVVEGLNNKGKVTMRRSYGFRTFRILELALYHSLPNYLSRTLPMNSSDEFKKRISTNYRGEKIMA